MSRDESEVEIAFEVTSGADGTTFSLHIEASEKLTYEEFLGAIRTFLETEELEPSSQKH